MNISELTKHLNSRSIVLIIVPTSELVFDSFDELKGIDFCNPNLDKIFDRLIGAITIEDSAIYMLEREREAYKRVLSVINEAKADIIAQAIYELGKRFFNILQKLEAYENGYLIYIKKGWKGYNMVLTKIDPGELPEIH